MTTDDSEKTRILKEARLICIQQHEALIVSDIFELGDGYVIVLANPTIEGHGPPLLMEVLRAASDSLLLIKGVKRVMLDVTPP